MKLNVVDEFSEMHYASDVYKIEEDFNKSKKKLSLRFNICLTVYVVALCLIAICTISKFDLAVFLTLSCSVVFCFFYIFYIIDKQSLIERYEFKISDKHPHNIYKALHDFCGVTDSICVDYFNADNVVLRDSKGNSFSIDTTLISIRCSNLPIESAKSVALKIENDNATFILE